jgi:MFS family permease
MANDRAEEALEVMAKYHGEGDKNSPIVQLEYQEMAADISLTGSDKRWWDYSELFNSSAVRYRTMLVVTMVPCPFDSPPPSLPSPNQHTAQAFFGQWSGNRPVSYYYPQMLQGTGITDNKTRLLYNGVQNVISFAGAVVGATFTDRWGRRPQLLVSTAIVIALFCCIIALNATNVYSNAEGFLTAKPSAASKAEIAVIFIFWFVMSCGYPPLQALYPVKVLRFESCAKGMGFYNFWVNVAGFYNTFVTGIAFTGAGWKYYLRFISWDVCEFIFIYFLFVETKNRTLEELTEIFAAKNPVRFSLMKTEVKVVSTKEGVVKDVVDEAPKTV